MAIKNMQIKLFGACNTCIYDSIILVNQAVRQVLGLFPIIFCLASVCLSLCPSVCELLTFFTSPEPLGQLQLNLVQNIPVERGLKQKMSKIHH